MGSYNSQDTNIQYIVLLMSRSLIKKIYEDDHVVAIAKPANLMVHPDGRSKEKTLVDWVKKQYPGIEGVGENFIFEESGKKKVITRPGIVHRLDKETSGVLLICKTEEAFRKLKAQFKAHSIKKVYRALVWGHVKNDTGIIDAPIARSKSDFRARVVPNFFDEDFRGTEREATTRYKVLDRMYAKSGDTDLPVTYIELFPLTGRTHQIRVHCKSIRHPIVDDTLYGPEGKPSLLGRTALHASKITFVSPKAGQVTVEAELPNDFKEALAKLCKV